MPTLRPETRHHGRRAAGAAGRVMNGAQQLRADDGDESAHPRREGRLHSLSPEERKAEPGRAFDALDGKRSAQPPRGTVPVPRPRLPTPTALTPSACIPVPDDARLKSCQTSERPMTQITEAVLITQFIFLSHWRHTMQIIQSCQSSFSFLVFYFTYFQLVSDDDEAGEQN